MYEAELKGSVYKMNERESRGGLLMILAVTAAVNAYSLLWTASGAGGMAGRL